MLPHSSSSGRWWRIAGTLRTRLWSKYETPATTDEQIIEMVATINLATFTNYMNNFMGTEVDLPIQKPTGDR